MNNAIFGSTSWNGNNQSDDDISSKTPSVYISDEEIDESINEWKFSLIGFFIIKLDNEVDMRYIWNGYWIVETQVLKLREWETNFNPAAQKITTDFVWINFPGLGMEYWKEKIIMDLGERFGRAIKVDETTLKKEVGYYASVLVEVDLSRYIPNQIEVKSKYGSFTQEVQIPHIPKFCNHCKVVGHWVAECRSNRDNT
ncbi:uncharacterized protein LOC113359984 [Papaver somniferum]|uniref:uncharacterized protein LOC113359984 n=1 Tax=Papaver somniferum TaxID=3469 RepID=UPI000E700DF4|nr:uncharacterized protein LOC113359984 [Papaver somniferum]